MARLLIIAIAFATISLHLHAYAQPMSPDAPDRLKKQLQQMIQERNVPIQFAGKVIDQNGESVANANVEMSLGYFGAGPSSVQVYAKTDSDGLFEFKNIGGSYLSIRDIIADGYDFQREDQLKKRFEYWTEIEENLYVPSLEEPEIFHVRKKNKPTFLISGEVTKKLEKDTIFYMDLGKTRMFPEDDKRFIRNIRISAKREEDRYFLMFEMLNEGAGILLTDRPLYEAPESGYDRKTTIEIDVGERNKVSMVVKTSIGMYSRLDAVLTAHRDVVILRIVSLLNPFGERSLELDEDVPNELRIKLHREAQSMIPQGQKLELPDRYRNQ